MTPELPDDFREFLSCLMSHGVRFVVVGAHALAVLGPARSTRDIDVLVEPTKANAKKLGQAFREFGFPALAAAAPTQLAEPERMTTLGVEPIRIDVMTSIDGVSFEEAYAGRVMVKLGDLDVPFLGLDAMVRNKRAAGRAKDRADLALLAEAGLIDEEDAK